MKGNPASAASPPRTIRAQLQKDPHVYSRITLCIAVALLCATGSLAAGIDPGLESRLFSAPESERFSVILKLYNPQDIRALDLALHARRAPLAERHRVVIEALQSNAADTQGPVLDLLSEQKRDGSVVGYTAYWIENLIVVLGSPGAILELKEHPDVESIGFNFRAELIEPVPRGPRRSGRPSSLDVHFTTAGQRATGAARVNSELGITGQGVLVAGVDTGVDRLHPALASRWRGNTAPVGECWLDLLGNRPLPVDNNGHGTHTMGSMCGREYQTNGDTITVGAAPNARWIATNPINQSVGAAFIQDIFDAFEWLADPDGNPNTMEDVPDVIQNSWGVTQGHVGTPCYNNWNTVITNCEAAGPVVIWSAGNEGTAGLRSPATYELNPYQIFAVGAVNANSETPPFPVATFSSRGPSDCPPDLAAVKPEITAPGVAVYSCVPGGGYEDEDWSGTSMSGPHVAGVVALMREACPDCDYITIKEALMNTAIDEGYPPVGDDNIFGHGFLNAYDAVLAVASLGRVDGYITTSAGNPLPGVRVQAVPTPRAARSDSSGYYNLSAQQGVYTMRYSKFGYETVTVPGVETFEGDTTRVNVEMTPAAAGVLAGTVRLQSGVGVQGARVTIQDTPLDTLITDAHGRFVVNLPATGFNVHVRFTVNHIPPLVIEADTNLIVQAGDTTFAEIEVFVGIVEPSAADNYGYRAYDRYDRDRPAPYDWIELDPLFGYPGREFFFSHGDSAVFFPAPFPISFYGGDWDTLTVNCDGWMLPGVHHDACRINTPIPFVLNDPPGIIAPYWDDLREARAFGAQNFVWYDRDHGRWIFEFVYQRLAQLPGPLMNWQVHFLDPAFYPTTTGDCDMVFVYGDMGNINGCTIGIENPDENTGVQVLFNGTLDPNSWPIENGAALRFSTGRPTDVGSVLATVFVYPTRNDITGAVLHVGGRALSPVGLGFEDDSVAAGTVSALFLYPGYEAWRGQFALDPDGAEFPDIFSYRLDPPRDLSAVQHNGEVTLSWRRPMSTESPPPPYIMRYSIYRNDEEIATQLTDSVFTDQPQEHGVTANYTVKAHYRFGASDFSDTLAVEIDLPVSETASALPGEFRLYSNFPNPFNPTTTLRFDVPEPADVRLEVFDVTGRLVRTLHRGVLNAGRHSFVWNGTDASGSSVATGLYLCRAASPHYTAMQKMLLVK